MPNILEKLQRLEESRIKVLSGTLSHLMIMETELSTVRLRAIDTIDKTIKSIDIGDDLAEFINQYVVGIDWGKYSAFDNVADVHFPVPPLPQYLSWERYLKEKQEGTPSQTEELTPTPTPNPDSSDHQGKVVAATKLLEKKKEMDKKSRRKPTRQQPQPQPQAVDLFSTTSDDLIFGQEIQLSSPARKQEKNNTGFLIQKKQQQQQELRQSNDGSVDIFEEEDDDEYENEEEKRERELLKEKAGLGIEDLYGFLRDEDNFPQQPQIQPISRTQELDEIYEREQAELLEREKKQKQEREEKERREREIQDQVQRKQKDTTHQDEPKSIGSGIGGNDKLENIFHQVKASVSVTDFFKLYELDVRFDKTDGRSLEQRYLSLSSKNDPLLYLFDPEEQEMAQRKLNHITNVYQTVFKRDMSRNIYKKFSSLRTQYYATSKKLSALLNLDLPTTTVQDELDQDQDEEVTIFDTSQVQTFCNELSHLRHSIKNEGMPPSLIEEIDFILRLVQENRKVQPESSHHF